MVSVVVFEFSVMRCQPLRRALYFFLVQYVIMLKIKSKAET
ncbi:acetyltransferase [Vibrio cholerae]|nr:acetyltransferase [Vibrio cholerae]TYW48473.1 acetyltransferase [Vibrio cholerae]